MAIIHFNKLKLRQTGRQKAVQPVSRLAVASRTGKLIRSAFATALEDINDPRHTKRLCMELFQLILPGQKWVSKLEGFEFNSRATLSSLFTTLPTSVINRTTGTVHMTVPELRIPDHILLLPDATHCQYTLVCAIIHFRKGIYHAAMAPGQLRSIGDNTPYKLHLRMDTRLDDPDAAWVTGLGLSFSCGYHGQQVAIHNRKHNAFAIIGTA